MMMGAGMGEGTGRGSGKSEVGSGSRRGSRRVVESSSRRVVESSSRRVVESSSGVGIVCVGLMSMEGCQMAKILTPEDAAGFAGRWYAAWNAHDLDAIMACYDASIEHSS